MCEKGPCQIDADLAFKTSMLPGETKAAFEYDEFLEEESSEEARKRLFRTPEDEAYAKKNHKKREAINLAREKYVTFITRKLGISEIHPNLDSKSWKPPLGQVSSYLFLNESNAE